MNSVMIIIMVLGMVVLLCVRFRIVMFVLGSLVIVRRVLFLLLLLSNLKVSPYRNKAVMDS